MRCQSKTKWSLRVVNQWHNSWSKSAALEWSWLQSSEEEEEDEEEEVEEVGIVEVGIEAVAVDIASNYNSILIAN